MTTNSETTTADGELVKAYVLNDRFQADLITDALDQEDLPYYLQEYRDTAYDGIFVTQKGWGAIWVDEINLLKAREIIFGLVRAFEEET
ncbi:MAG: hypothetical protein HQK58_10240 [Deltaproteobacteria bacterium]|nr:hypothetical protein [Deltaproteobacteria bacterium]